MTFDDVMNVHFAFQILLSFVDLILVLSRGAWGQLFHSDWSL